MIIKARNREDSTRLHLFGHLISSLYAAVGHPTYRFCGNGPWNYLFENIHTFSDEQLRKEYEAQIPAYLAPPATFWSGYNEKQVKYGLQAVLCSGFRLSQG